MAEDFCLHFSASLGSEMRWGARIFTPKKAEDLCFRERIRIQLFLRSLKSNGGEGGVSSNWTALRTQNVFGYPIKSLP